MPIDVGGRARRIAVVLNNLRVLKFRVPYAEALIGNNKIADLLPLTNRSIYVLGKEIGSTSLAILDENKEVISVLQIEVTPDIRDLRSKLRDNLPFARIKVSAANGRILLSGTVPDALAANKAVAIAGQYAPNAVTNALTVRSPQQVMLEVRFVEASRTASRELGIGWRVRGDNVNTNIGVQSTLIGGAIIAGQGLISGAQPFGTLIAKLLEGGTNADAIIKALEKRGLARRLAEPNLVTLSGVTASFLAGGEFPFPVDAGDGKISVDFKQFGVALDFTPTVLAGGLINLKIEPEVSELDENAGIQANGIQIPGLVVRRASTTVELRDGQSFAIAGLLQQTHIKTQSQVPWLGQVPVLGALFRSAEYRKRESDLVIIVTPRLVEPATPRQHLVTALDRSKATNDPEFFVGGRMEVPATRSSIRQRLFDSTGASYGHIIQLTNSSNENEWQ